jgi:hypothetical protein
MKLASKTVSKVTFILAKGSEIQIWKAGKLIRTGRRERRLGISIKKKLHVVAEETSIWGVEVVRN